MPECLEKGFHLGAVEVRPAENVLLRDGRSIHIEPKAMEVMLALAEAGQETISRKALVDRVWPRGYVSDDALNHCISSLRSALGDNARAPSFIVTIARKGYCLAQPVVPCDGGCKGGLVVLPFRNLSPLSEEYTADALTELLIARLSVALDERVISRTTSMTLRRAEQDLGSISRQLGVRWVVEGSCMTLGERLQIVVQLIDGRSDTHIWAETWTRPISDLLTLLNEVTRLVSSQIRKAIAPHRPPQPPPASLPIDLLRQYLHGVQLNSRRTHDALRGAIRCFENVLREQPDHAPSLAAQAMSHMLLAHYGAVPAEEGFSQGRKLAEAALRLDSQLTEAMVHLAAVNFHFDWDFRQAEERASRAVEINPNLEMAWLVLANINLVRRRQERALHCIDRALSLDPLNTGILMNAGDHLILQRRYGEAIRVLQEALDIDPAFRPACLRLALALAFNGSATAARDCLAQAQRPGERDGPYLEYEAIVMGSAGQTALAERAASELQELADRTGNVLPWSLARAWAATGRTEQAVGWLEKSFSGRSSSMPFLAATPVLDSIRSHVRVRQMTAKLGLD